MADLSKIQIGITVYNVKDAVARNSLTPATQTKNGVMSATDKKKLDGIVVIDVSGAGDIYSGIKTKKAEIAAAINSEKVIYIKWGGTDGPSLHPTTWALDSSDIFFTVWGDPLIYYSDDSSVIAVEFYSDDMDTNGFTSYRLISASKSDFTAI